MLILHKDSHVDHNLTQAQVQFILDRFKDREGDFIESFDLPPELGEVPCGLFGPEMGDEPVPEEEVLYQSRGSRKHSSRLVRRPPRSTRLVTVIAGPHDGLPCVWYTAFGGPVTPKEPGDQSHTDDSRDSSEAFWKQHALAIEK